MPRPKRTGTYLAWRRPGAGEPSRFELLLGRRWLVGATVAAATVCASAAGIPRERWPRIGRWLAGGGLATGVLVLAESIRGVAFPLLKRVELPLENLPAALDGFTIGQISDFHLGMPLTKRALRRGIDIIMAARPDVLVITGDCISNDRHRKLVAGAVRSLSAPHGVFGIFGNHDHWTDIQALEQALEAAGVTVLFNEHRVLRIGDAQLVLVGVDDMWEGEPDLQSAMEGIPEGAPTILLAHAPDFAAEAARYPAIQAQIAGHTHGGHISLPGLGALFLPRHGILYDQGLWRVGQMWLYVSTGIGGWPLRIGCRTQVTLFTLRPAASGTRMDTAVV